MQQPLNAGAFGPGDYLAWKNSYLLLPPQKNRWDLKPRPASDLTRAQFRKVLTKQKRLRKEDKFFDLVAFDRRTGEIVARVSLMEIVRSVSQTCFLGYTVNSTHWGKGYGKETVLAGIDIGFRDLQLHRIEAGIEPGNRRSWIFTSATLGDDPALRWFTEQRLEAFQSDSGAVELTAAGEGFDARFGLRMVSLDRPETLQWLGRFLGRIHDPLKQWKLSPMDLESRRRWEDYTRAKEAMLERTHIPEAPWWTH